MNSGTFSILAAYKNRKAMGIAVASGSTSVGSRVPHAMPSVGVVATQAYTNVDYGVKGLKMLAENLPPREVMEMLLAEDYQREMRQVAIMDFALRKAFFTGSKTPEWRGEIIGENYIVIGNFLKNAKVIESIADSFINSQEDLALRLLTALKAGSESGGDKRGEKSAAIIVVDTVKVRLNLSIDEHETPIQELMKLVKNFKQENRVPV